MNGKKARELRKIDKTMFVGIAFIIIVSFLGTMAFLGSTTKPKEKEFIRYYIRHTSPTIEVMIQWDGAEDEVSFASFDPQQVMWVYEQLKEMECKTEETPPIPEKTNSKS